MFREFTHFDHYDRRHSQKIAPSPKGQVLLPVWLRGPLLGALVAAVLGGTLGALDPGVARENALLENAQVVLIAFAVLLHVRKGLSARVASVGAGHGLLALFCLSVIAREIDIDELGAAAVWGPVEMGIRSAIALGWFILLGFAARQWRGLLKRSVVLSRTSILTSVAIGLYAIGWSFEKIGGLAPSTALLWEELLQLCGAVFFLAGSIRDLGSSTNVPEIKVQLEEESASSGSRSSKGKRSTAALRKRRIVQ